MNIYVVSNVWDREGSTVIGAAVDRAGAEQIADRTEHPGDKDIRNGWSPWTERTNPREARTWDRLPMYLNGTYHHSMSQEIVCVPLAGMPELPDFAREWVDAVAKVIPPAVPEPGKTTITYPWADERLSVIDEWCRAVVAHERAVADSVRVGTGAAQRWLDQAVAAMPGSRPATTGVSQLLGIPIVFDASIPPDEIRIGSTVYVVGTADGIVNEGQMVVINLDGTPGVFREP